MALRASFPLLAFVVLSFAVRGDDRATTPAAPAPVLSVPSTFEQSESERRWGATDDVSPLLRERLDRLDNAARARATKQVGLAPFERAALARVRRAADRRRGEIEAEGLRGPLDGRTLGLLHRAATAELAALASVLGVHRALALRAAEREAYGALVNESGDLAPAIIAFAQRRRLFLRMGRLTGPENGPPGAALPPIPTGAGGMFSAAR